MTAVLTGDQWFMFLPTPGVAYWVTGVDPSTTAATWTAVLYPDFASVFGDNNANPYYGTVNVERFRYVSMNMEVKNISAVLNSAGAIHAARCPGIEISKTMGPTGNMNMYLTGSNSITPATLSTMPGSYMGHINDGVYGWAVDLGDEFEFSDIWINTNTIPDAEDNALAGKWMGFGNVTPIGMSITGTSGASTTYMLMVESCIEYVPRAGSLLANMANPSPPHDPLALESYSSAAKKMPAFVPAKENAGFWDKFLGIVGTVAPILGSFFGPVGRAVGMGVGMASDTIRAAIV